MTAVRVPEPATRCWSEPAPGPQVWIRSLGLGSGKVSNGGEIATADDACRARLPRNGAATAFNPPRGNPPGGDLWIEAMDRVGWDRVWSC